MIEVFNITFRGKGVSGPCCFEFIMAHCPWLGVFQANVTFNKHESQLDPIHMQARNVCRLDIYLHGVIL